MMGSFSQFLFSIHAHSHFRKYQTEPQHIFTLQNVAYLWLRPLGSHAKEALSGYAFDTLKIHTSPLSFRRAHALKSLISPFLLNRPYLPTYPSALSISASHAFICPLLMLKKRSRAPARYE